ncbi:MAG: flagellar export chaperone FliS [Candidatus Handelsmanbacteria bacterium RIFCSPLOWO2_12_FULL_64_10]|uniref:Flagellar secretion chaperone FliS n=1 Tax=Handelsmanbacteria sp. (strain RIFCSPLOWO2_12_FULL_64_10) TaxID=1817868 RepID=A0A1F6CCA0_HANXR|nr:MAG: flagellar export chaperone FliS [Candidatus Handelsmanbacteria bacterium RIFCSPLOWO2_12_FULL_64_10]
MTKPNTTSRYRQVQIATASRGRLILMLYQGAITSLKKAVDLLEKKDYMGKGECIIKAQDIIMELNMALDMSAGEIARSLRGLYVYMYRRLIEANLRKDAAPIHETIRIMSNLYEAWEQVVTEKDDGGMGKLRPSRISIVR